MDFFYHSQNTKPKLVLVDDSTSQVHESNRSNKITNLIYSPLTDQAHDETSQGLRRTYFHGFAQESRGPISVESKTPNSR
ncbi:hypothetical protein N7478_005927 [Penicillium angulare]|uniref:uncharacterized protein n=1 Tax=Penicillium angulare TaxID=116970 RepID=UPI00253FD2D1|nr:uncharacterized protein N7478_005927 [Penicillium angulare]KAJ5280555.1 hypothetical protein N7478_005927 [Penicillium angulare]